MTENSEKTTKNPAEHLKKHQWKKGQTGNPGGRPKGSLKSYVAKKLAEMSNEQKEEFLRGISSDLIWQMGEGRPSQGLGQADDLPPIPILGGIAYENNKEE